MSLKLDSLRTLEETTYTLYADFNPYPLNVNDTIRMCFGNDVASLPAGGFVAPLCSDPFVRTAVEAANHCITCRLFDDDFVPFPSGNIVLINVLNPVCYIYIYIYILYT